MILTSKHLFRTFQVENESANYRLHVGGASGTAGDSLTSDLSHHLMMFTTRDRDNDRFFYSFKVFHIGEVLNIKHSILRSLSNTSKVRFFQY